MNEIYGMAFTNSLAGVICIIIGYYVKKKKASHLIAGYNTAKPEEKAKWNEENLIKYTGNLCYALGGSLMIPIVIAMFFKKYAIPVMTAGWYLFLLLILVNLIFGNKIGCFKK